MLDWDHPEPFNLTGHFSHRVLKCVDMKLSAFLLVVSTTTNCAANRCSSNHGTRRLSMPLTPSGNMPIDREHLKTVWKTTARGLPRGVNHYNQRQGTRMHIGGHRGTNISVKPVLGSVLCMSKCICAVCCALCACTCACK